ncbi:NADPH:quinone reductase [Microlunatus antarcticus]|uniref:NADPH2:quinone reductase n=1 Tax=Microlunatus antarcticus TaxID=53388 RepID=A0A7W5JWJ2_9ACTN|nr:NADPH:quinone reductase [Microlunatus antarcticus]MBB3327614.1 NADPH2:quinone reductase [Microlunatus antarcticus]
MRTVVYAETGGPEVLRLTDEPVPEPGPGELRVRVLRSGVNPTDWKSRAGRGPGSPVDPPQIPGQDGAGVVEAVGEGVPASWLGLDVWVFEAAFKRRWGTTSEHTLVRQTHLAALPSRGAEGAPYDLGAALGIPFITAHRCLTVHEEGPLRLGPGTLQGRTVLVSGGAGAVGNAAIQLARWSDATILTTVSSPAKGRLAAAAGADHVIDYRETDVRAEVRRIVPGGVDVVVEVNPQANAGLDGGLLAPGAVVVTYADDGGGAEVAVPVRTSMVRNVRWQFVLVYTLPAAAKARAVDDLGAALLDGAIGVGDAHGLPLHHFPLEQAAQAQEAVERGAVGKVLITP